jgi:heme-degrading monooxygenase HmoA
MIRHVVMIRFKTEVSQEQQLEFAQQAAETLGKIPGVKNFIAGLAVNIEGKPAYDGALFIDFDDEAKFKAYFNHPVHKAAGEQFLTSFSEVLALDCQY